MENYLDLKNCQIDYNILKLPANILKSGGIVIFPTETVYGIGTNCFNTNSIQKLYNIKNRPLNKPISLLISNMTMLDQIATNISDLEYKLMEKFFPGPLTLILNKKDIVPNILTSNTNTVGVRMPNNSITLKLIEYANAPIATSSANISGYSDYINLDYLTNTFHSKVDYFIDGGNSKIGIASTVVKIVDGCPHILRLGSISKEEICSFCKSF